METLKTILENDKWKTTQNQTETLTITPTFLSSNTTLTGWDSQIPYEFRGKNLEDLKDLPTGLINFGNSWQNLYPWQNLFLFGQWGAGKTSFACSVVRSLIIKCSGKGYFFPRYIFARDLDNALLNAQKNGIDDEEMERWVAPKVLLIDDVDKVTATERFKMQLFELMKKRIEDGSTTILTSNCTPTDLSLLLDGSLVSRMLDQTKWKIIQFPDRDLRKIQLELNTIKF